ncbi:hypothetical protein B0H13DRAFT_2357397 [Mycena leptocephala]|nr:hypothetical protein B0H13DRAFT_2357397 [Mycena leptocephala]
MLDTVDARLLVVRHWAGETHGKVVVGWRGIQAAQLLIGGMDGLEEGVEAAVLWEEKGMDWGKFVMNAAELCHTLLILIHPPFLLSPASSFLSPFVAPPFEPLNMLPMPPPNLHESLKTRYFIIYGASHPNGRGPERFWIPSHHSPEVLTSCIDEPPEVWTSKLVYMPCAGMPGDLCQHAVSLHCVSTLATAQMCNKEKEETEIIVRTDGGA